MILSSPRPPDAWLCFRNTLGSLCLSFLLLESSLALAAAPEDPASRPAEPTQASASPQRPSVGFNTSTVPDGLLELEFGGSLMDGGSALPALLKWGLTDRVEIELAFDAVRNVEVAGDTVTSQGDLLIGVRSRLAGSGEARSFAFVGQLKAPTARDDAGSGEFDAQIIGIASMPAGRLSVDGNLWLSALGQADGSTLGQIQGVATLNLPQLGALSSFVEVAWQHTATRGSGGFFDAGVLYNASSVAVFDLAVGVGWSEGYPDWSVMTGWTFLFSKERPLDR